MTGKAQAIPSGWEHPTPYLVVRDGAAAIEFYKRAFGATEEMRLAGPGDKIAHAALKFGRGYFMLTDEIPEFGSVSPQTLGGSPVTIHLYVEDVDALVNRAVAAGAKVVRPVADQFYGDRAGRIEDPFGHVWIFSTHIEEVPTEEMRRRFQEMMKKQGE